MALAGRRAVPVHDPGRAPGQHRRQLARVPDRRRAADDDRVAAVVGADPEQPPQDVGDVPAEHAAVGVQLVDDDEPQLLEEQEPLRVVGQDRGVEHVRVGRRRPARPPGWPSGSGPACRRRRSTLRSAARPPATARELGDLVLPERLGREQEERPGGRVVGDRLEDGQGVAERLARRRRRDDDDVVAGLDRLDRLGLVGVRPLDPAARQAGDDPRIEPRRESASSAGRAAGRRDGRRRARATARRAARRGRRRVGGGVGAHRRLLRETERMFETAASLADRGRAL